MGTKFWEITRKDLKLLFRDLRALATLVVFPMIFITIIGLTTGRLLGWKNTNQLLRIAYADDVDYESIVTAFDDPARDLQERKRARNIVTKIVNELQQAKGIQLYEAPDRATAVAMTHGQEDAEGRTANAALVFGPDFYQKFQELDPRDLLDARDGVLQRDGLAALDMEMISDSASTTSAVIERLVTTTVGQVAGVYAICDQGGVMALQFRTTCNELSEEMRQPPLGRLPPGEAVEEATTGNVYEEIVPSFTVMFVFFLVNVMARSFIKERELGTLRRLRMAPLHPADLLIGKTVPFYILSLAQTAILFLLGRLLFDMPWGTQPWLLLPVIFATSLAATALGLMISTIVRSDAQVSAYANVVVITLAGISGCFFPREWLPDHMRTLSLGTPHAYAIIAYNEILTVPDPDYSDIAACCGMLLAFSVVFFAFGVWKFHDLDE